MKLSFYTLGCKLNQAETDELRSEVVKLGFEIVPYESEEDVVIVRACGVTCNASRGTRNVIYKSKRNGAYVIVTGCIENNDLTEIDFLGKNNQQIINHLKDKLIIVDNDKQKNNSLNIFESKTRKFIKIQNGCNFQCTYCIIPSFRGKSESEPIENIIQKIHQAEDEGVQEIVLTGVNICQYNNNLDLADLLKIIADKTKITRIRLGSLDPRLITNKLINQFTNKQLLPHIHLSLQSGSDSVLKRMNRNYTQEKYLKIIHDFRINNPLFSFTTDIIVGFPGETDEEFQQTCEFVKKAKFAKIHIFPYSERPNTSAADLQNKVAEKTKKERVKILSKIADETANEFAKQFIGLEKEVLFEKQTPQNIKEGCWEGYTPEYIRVKYFSEEKLENKILRIKIGSENIIN